MPFPLFQFLGPRSRRQAPRALRERLECSEGGSTGRRAKRPYRLINCAQPAVRSAPNQDRRSARFIGVFGKNARQMPVPGPEARRSPCIVKPIRAQLSSRITDNIRANRRERQIRLQALQLDRTAPAVSFGAISDDRLTMGNYGDRFRISGAGQPGGRDGQGPRVKFHPRAADFRRS